MERLEYYRKLLDIIHEDAQLVSSMPTQASSADILSGSLNAGFIDLGDILPQLTRDELDRVLVRLAASGAKVIAVISVYYSDEILESGSNLHLTVESQAWWKAMLEQHFPSSEYMKGHRDSEFVWTNFKLSSSSSAQIDALGKISSLRRELTRLGDRAKLVWKAATGQCVARSNLLAELRGKRVAVVGNARSLKYSEFGAEIDAHDMVIRFNRVPIVSRISHGYKTSWVATGVPITQRRLQSLGASHVLWLSPYRRKLPSETIAVDRLYLHPVSEVQSLATRSGVRRPTTGLTAIDLLSETEVGQVSIYGFDFYQSQSSSSHQTIEAAPHQFDREELFVMSLIERDTRFRVRRGDIASLRHMS